MMIRPLTEIAEFQKCVEVQSEIWGCADIDIMPARYFVTNSHIGGLVLGAFDADRLVAFLNATPALREGMAYWRSHMLAVLGSHGNSGIGPLPKRVQPD